MSITFSKDVSLYDNPWTLFTSFQERFHKRYDTMGEVIAKFETFNKNIQSILEHNSLPNKTFTMGINQFTDLSPEEFKQQYASGYQPIKSLRCSPFQDNTSYLSIDHLDWTEKGVVNPVRDQGQCGSCWAFATTANAESAWAISTGQLLDMSEQYLVDCSKGLNQGCNGGEMDAAFNYMIENGQCSEASYPYTGVQSKVCKINNLEKTDDLITFSKCYDVKSKDQLALKTAVSQNPVVVAIEADTRYFQSYSSGILTDAIKCGTDLDHAVEIVGYGTENGINYWKVRNSWSNTWGENGYVRIERSESRNDIGVCGISAQPSFIIV
jgi:C1A family cysteine protease